MVSIEIDFDFDDAFAEMFLRASKHEFTIMNDGELTLEDVKEILTEGQKTGSVQDKERLGYLKIFVDDTLVGLSVPRVIDKREYRAWAIDPEKEYHRMGMIFIDEPYRGQGIAKQAAVQFIQEYPNLIWVIDPVNEPSKKVAAHIGLRHNVSLYTLGSLWRHKPWRHEKVLEVWSN